MKIFKNPNELKKVLRSHQKEGKSIGFVPTMGFLHAGHLSLVERARVENDYVVVSVFINPTQFGPNEDLESYPRDFEKDCHLIQEIGCDFVFAPEANDLYPSGYSTYVEVSGTLTKGLCGSSRPEHFRGVATIVSKLFNIVRPDRAYFGQKDAQQVAVIEQMVADLNMDVEIIPCPIIREVDGLAMSSRNTYLSAAEREQALMLSKSLKIASELIEVGEREASVINRIMEKTITTAPLAKIDYIEIVSAKTLMPVEKLIGTILIAIAVKIGRTRLIDNIRIEVK